VAAGGCLVGLFQIAHREQDSWTEAHLSQMVSWDAMEAERNSAETGALERWHVALSVSVVAVTGSHAASVQRHEDGSDGFANVQRVCMLRTSLF